MWPVPVCVCVPDDANVYHAESCVVSKLQAAVSVWIWGWLLTPQGLPGTRRPRSRRQSRVSPCNLLSHRADREKRHKLDSSLKTVGAPVLNERPSQLSSGCSSQVWTAHITIYTFNWKALVTLNTFITEKEKWASVPVHVGSHSSLVIKAVCRLHTHKLDHFTERPSENCYCTLPTIYILPFKCCKLTQIWNYPQ